jgi:UDP-2,3-diacylglucosamine hydrolase
VHIKSAGDPAEVLLLAFLRNPDVQSSDVIFLLGDIFDLMIGHQSQYFLRFPEYFEEIKKLIKKGKQICYVEGNHDFHIKELYKTFFNSNRDLDSTLFMIAPYFEFLDAEKIIYLAHGDDVELGNPSYRIWKTLVASKPLEYFANYLMPHFVIKGIGEYSSEKSRARNIVRYSTESDLSAIKENFRNSTDEFYKKKEYQIIVLGHSHAKDHYISSNGFEYVNNGYAQHSKTYISILDGNISFRSVF